MDFQLSTFTLSIINFLVLMWILYRFLYNPVLKMIDQRRASIEQSMADAERMREEADTLGKQQAGLVAAWEQEKTQAQARLKSELETERRKALESLHQQLDEERKKNEAQEAKRLRETIRHAEESALRQAGVFAARLLERVASPQLEAALVKVVLDDLAALPPERKAELRRALKAEKTPVQITSAFALSDGDKQALNKALSALAGQEVPCAFAQEVALVAGIRISLAYWVLSANVGEELRFFQEVGHGS